MILLIATNAGLIGVSRLTFSMGHYRQLPERLRQIHPRSAAPRLFGLFDLSEVLEALGIDKMPAFVTETLGAVQGLLADIARLTGAVEQAVADANQVIADAQAAGSTPIAWATQTKAELEGLAGQLRAHVDALADALADLLDPTVPKDADAIKALFTPIQGAYVTLQGAVGTIAFPPALKAPLQRHVAALAPYLPEPDPGLATRRGLSEDPRRPFLVPQGPRPV